VPPAGGPTVPSSTVKFPVTFPVEGTIASETAEQPTGTALPWMVTVGAVKSPLHSVIEPNTPGVKPVAV